MLIHFFFMTQNVYQLRFRRKPWYAQVLCKKTKSPLSKSVMKGHRSNAKAMLKTVKKKVKSAVHYPTMFQTRDRKTSFLYFKIWTKDIVRLNLLKRRRPFISPWYHICESAMFTCMCFKNFKKMINTFLHFEISFSSKFKMQNWFFVTAYTPHPSLDISRSIRMGLTVDVCPSRYKVSKISGLTSKYKPQRIYKKFSPVCSDVVHQSGPEEDKHHARDEAGSFRHGAKDQGRGDAGKLHLEQHKHESRHLRCGIGKGLSP